MKTVMFAAVAVTTLLPVADVAIGQTLTGCLRERTGDLSRLQVGGSPSRECRTGEVEVSLPLAGGSSGYVVRDADGQVVGDVLSFAATWAAVAIPVDGGAGPAIVELNTLSGAAFNRYGEVYFADAGCTGQAYVSPFAGAAPAFSSGVVVENSTGGESLYVATGPEPATTTVTSRLRGGFCESIGPNALVREGVFVAEPAGGLPAAVLGGGAAVDRRPRLADLL